MSNGASGVVLFGFVTQFYRLSFAEKRESLRSTVAAIAGQGRVGVTVMEPSPKGQAELIRVAREEGADGDGDRDPPPARMKKGRRGRRPSRSSPWGLSG